MDRLEKTQRIADAALERKAEDVVALDVRELASFTDTFLFATGGSDRQTRAIADSITQAMREAGDPVIGVEGYKEGSWILIDANDAIIHIFTESAREHYGLERLWSDAPSIVVQNGEAESATS